MENLQAAHYGCNSARTHKGPARPVVKAAEVRDRRIITESAWLPDEHPETVRKFLDDCDAVIAQLPTSHRGRFESSTVRGCVYEVSASGNLTP
jgi:hypothetical protein